MRPGDRPNLPLEAEPALLLHPALTGGAVPFGVHPVPGPFGLEEEPALWPGVAGRPAAARMVSLAPVRLRGTTTPAPSASLPVEHHTGLAATGLTSQLPIAGIAVAALALLLRRRNEVAKRDCLAPCPMESRAGNCGCQATG